MTDDEEIAMRKRMYAKANAVITAALDEVHNQAHADVDTSALLGAIEQKVAIALAEAHDEGELFGQASQMPQRIELVVSETQDECTICNRWFLTHAEAWNYAQATEEESGCVMKTFSVQRG